MMFLCEACGLFYDAGSLNQHLAGFEHNYLFVNYFIQIESAAKRRLVTLLAQNPNQVATVYDYMEALRQNVVYYLQHYLSVHQCLKYNMVLECHYYKDGDNLTEMKNFKTPNASLFQLSDVNAQYTADIAKL